MNDERGAGGEDLMRYQTVRTWIEHATSAGLRPGSDRARRLELLQRFCAHVGSDPDTIVQSARGDADTKNGYLKRLVSWAGGLPLSERGRHDAENTIRGFFMRNGFRVVARPYRDVYVRDAK